MLNPYGPLSGIPLDAAFPLGNDWAVNCGGCILSRRGLRPRKTRGSFSRREPALPAAASSGVCRRHIPLRGFIPSFSTISRCRPRASKAVLPLRPEPEILPDRREEPVWLAARASKAFPARTAWQALHFPRCRKRCRDEGPARRAMLSAWRPASFRNPPNQPTAVIFRPHARDPPLRRAFWVSKRHRYRLFNTTSIPE